MNARVFLLLLVTAAFMAIWDADRPSELRQIVARSKVPGVSVSAAVESARIQAPVAHALTDVIGEKDGAPLKANANEDALIPLPKGLLTGTWHAFNHQGDTIRITIERETISARSPKSDVPPTFETEANSCVITGSDGVRWCFIKEENAAAE